MDIDEYCGDFGDSQNYEYNNNNCTIKSFDNKEDNDYCEKVFNYEQNEEIISNSTMFNTPEMENEKNNIPEINDVEETIEKKLGPIIVNNIKNNKKTGNNKKVKKNLGRKSKSAAKITQNNDKVHTKYKDDNIRTKIIRALIRHSLEYINNLLKLSKNPNLNCRKLFKVCKSVIILHKKEENLELLNKKLMDIFSQEVSDTYSIKHKNHNINTMNIILENNDETINAVLKTNLEEILKIYVGDIKNDIFKNFPTIVDDILIFKIKGENDSYIEKYKKIAKNFKESINSIDPRRKKRTLNNGIP